MTRDKLKRLEPGAIVVVDGKIRRVAGQERRKEGIGVLLKPHVRDRAAREFALPEDVRKLGV